MKKLYPTTLENKFAYLFLVVFLFINILSTQAQVLKTFNQRTSQFSPTKKIYNIKGDFAMLGNTNLTLQNYGSTGNTTDNEVAAMAYVDIDGDGTTINSSTSELKLSTENGAVQSCSKIVYAGLYWTGAKVSGASVTVNKSGTNYTLYKNRVKLKGPGAANYTTVTANSGEVYTPPSGSYDDIYASYTEITQYVRDHGIGNYTVADVASRTGSDTNPGYSGGWGMIVIYENSKMKWRDISVFDGFAYVVYSNSSGFNLPVSGFNTAQSGDVGLKLGVMASEGDVARTGDYFKIQNKNTNTYTSLSHSGNSTTNFFNSSIITGGTRNPTILNNTGIDIATVNIPNTNNSIIGNSQTSTNFKYGCSGGNGDTYSIFMIAMAVDAYVPVVEALMSPIMLNNVPVSVSSVTALPGDILQSKFDIRNKGNEIVNNSKFVLPIPYTADYVNGSLSKVINFTPTTPNSLYYDPSLGPKGSIVFDLGALPLPANINDILATITFKLKITEDCSVLKNSNCNQNVSISGFISGKGDNTKVEFSEKPFYIGYTSGTCDNEPIVNPLVININSAAYVTANCNDTIAREFVFCNAGSSIPITAISDGFPPGSLFYNEYPVTSSSIQYSITNPFPASSGTINYFAVPPGASEGCNFPYTIKITNIVNTPTAVTNLTYCQGDEAVALSATKSNNSNILFYYDSPTGTAQLSLIPSTAVPGQHTYYVAEAASGSCVGPKLPIVVTINAAPVAPTSGGDQNVCTNQTLTQTLTATATGGTITWYDAATNGNVIANPTQVGVGSTTYYAQSSNGTCSSLTRTPVKLTITPLPAAPTVLCYQTATWNPTSCQYDITGTQPVQPTLACYESATFDTTTCAWIVTGTQPVQPTLACYESATFDTTTCAWIVTGTQPVQPTLACYESATFDTATCAWIVTGTQPVQPTLACYESATFDTTTCAWIVTGTQPVQPTLACYESATFDTATCAWIVTGTQPVQPTLACYESATFDTTTCAWIVTGTQPVQPTLACYESATFDTTTCAWIVTGTQPVQPTLACYESASFDTTTCAWIVTGTQPVQPTLACYESASFDTTTCAWIVTGTQPVQPTLACYESASFDTTTCAWIVTGTQPVQPTLACYESATFDTTTCAWIVTGTQPIQPTLACYESATFDTATCAWIVTGTQPVQPTLACYESASFDTTTCAWIVTGTQPVQPTLACYESATFDTTTCAWIVTGTQPVQPTLACYESATFDTATCAWIVTGTQPVQPTLACYESASFDTTTCAWIVTGTQPVQPTLACYESASFDTTTCAWIVTGTQPVQPTLACYESASFDTTTCAWIVTGTQPVQPTLACYESASFDTTTCAWIVTGTQPVQPTLACYESATFDTTTCAWIVTGTQPIQPTLACYESASFDTTTCAWIVTGTQPVQPTLACYESAAFDTTTCAWIVTGTQPVQPTLACYESASFDTTTLCLDSDRNTTYSTNIGLL